MNATQTVYFRNREGVACAALLRADWQVYEWAAYPWTVRALEHSAGRYIRVVPA